MKINIFLYILFAVILTPCIYLHAYDWTEKIDVEVTEVPYRDVYAFLGIHFEPSGQLTAESSNGASITSKLTGFGMGLMSARKEDFQFETMLGYRSFSVEKLGIVDEDGGKLGKIEIFDMYIGGRFYPRYPTFALGRNPVRLTFSALGGLGLSNYSNMLFSMVITAGLSLSSHDSPSGLMIEYVYRPSFEYVFPLTVFTNETVTVGDYTGIRVGFLFGPVQR